METEDTELVVHFFDEKEVKNFNFTEMAVVCFFVLLSLLVFDLTFESVLDVVGDELAVGKGSNQDSLDKVVHLLVSKTHETGKLPAQMLHWN